MTMDIQLLLYRLLLITGFLPGLKFIKCLIRLFRHEEMQPWKQSKNSKELNYIFWHQLTFILIISPIHALFLSLQ